MPSSSPRSTRSAACPASRTPGRSTSCHTTTGDGTGTCATRAAPPAIRPGTRWWRTAWSTRRSSRPSACGSSPGGSSPTPTMDVPGRRRSSSSITRWRRAISRARTRSAGGSTPATLPSPPSSAWWRTAGKRGRSIPPPPPTAEMCWSYAQNNTRSVAFPIVVRVRRGEPGAVAGTVQAAIRSVEPAAAISQVRSLEEIIATSVGQPRFYLVLPGLFAAVALLLSAAGLYGLTTYAVARRTREIGIRTALGATPAQATALVLRDGVLLVAGGLAAGGALGVMATRLLTRLLYGVSPLDPVAWAAVSTVLALAGGVAAFVPARHAARVDPLAAIRAEGGDGAALPPDGAGGLAPVSRVSPRESEFRVECRRPGSRRPYRRDAGRPVARRLPSCAWAGGIRSSFRRERPPRSRHKPGPAADARVAPRGATPRTVPVEAGGPAESAAPRPSWAHAGGPEPAGSAGPGEVSCKPLQRELQWSHSE